MSMTSFALDPCAIEYWGDWRAQAEAGLQWIQASGCYNPRYVLVPGQGQLVIPPVGKIEYRFQLEPHSLIVAVSPYPNSGLFQLTEQCTGHTLFQDPTSGVALLTTGSIQDENVSFTPLPCSWEASADGWFKFEAWGTPGASAYLILYTCEVKPC